VSFSNSHNYLQILPATYSYVYRGRTSCSFAFCYRPRPV
jgi:hypothetical protein